MNKEQIVYKKVSELKGNAKNPRKNDSAVDTVAKSIEKYGFRNPLIIDADNVVWCGNTRLKASKKLGLEEVPCIVVTDLDEQKMTELALLDNKTNEIAEWDTEMLAEILPEVDFGEFEEISWGIPEIEEAKEVVEDEFDCTPPEEPKAKLGDIYQLGNHRLMCGDSTKEEDVEKLMGGELADLVVTDPPYNVDYKGTAGKIINDNMADNEFYEFLHTAFNLMQLNLKSGGSFYIWCIDHKMDLFINAIKNNNLIHNETLIWVKNTFVLGHLDYHKKHEPCLYGWKDGAGHYFTDDRTQSTVIEDKGIELKKLKKEELLKLLEEIFSDKVSTTVINEDKPSKCDLHPTMKPIKLLARLIKNSSKQTEIVLDLFGGSGSTLIACEQLNRNCYVMELDPKYVDVIIARWETLTGNKAEKIN